MRAHQTAARVLTAVVISGNAGHSQAPQNVVSAREAHGALVAATLYVLAADSLPIKGDTLPFAVTQPSVRQLLSGRQGPIAVSVQTSPRRNPGVEPGQEMAYATNVALALTKSGIDARAVEGAVISQVCPQHPRGSGKRGHVCHFAGAMSIWVFLSYPELNQDRLLVPMTVFSDKLGADGSTQSVNVTVVLSLVGGQWRVTGHQRLVGR